MRALGNTTEGPWVQSRKATSPSWDLVTQAPILRSAPPNRMLTLTLESLGLGMGADPAPAHRRTGAVKGNPAALAQDCIGLTLASTRVLIMQVGPNA